MLDGRLRVGLLRRVSVIDFGCRIHEYIEWHTWIDFPRPQARADGQKQIGMMVMLRDAWRNGVRLIDP